MVAKEGSFSRAGERLYRTQPAVSLAIRKLEDSLGQPLFIRGARPVRLTDAGTLLKDYAERLINLRDEVKKGLSELEGLKRGELSLGVNESSIHALLRALAKFRERHPGVQLRVHRMFSRDIPHEVLNYRLDLGAISFVPREPQLQATEILKDELILVVPPKHPLAKKEEVDVAELGRENFIAHIVESPFRRRVIELFARNRTALNMPIEMPKQRDSQATFSPLRYASLLQSRSSSYRCARLTSGLAILAIGFFLGMRHATDPDHVIAVSTIVSRERSISR